LHRNVVAQVFDSVGSKRALAYIGSEADFFELFEDLFELSHVIAECATTGDQDIIHIDMDKVKSAK
jgi:hypothetical protein